MSSTIIRDTPSHRTTVDAFSNDIESANIYSRSSQLNSQTLSPPRQYPKQLYSCTDPAPKVLQRSAMKMKKTQQLDAIFNRSNTPLVNLKRQHRGRLKRLGEIKQQNYTQPKQKVRYQGVVLPMSITKLTSPFLMELLYGRINQGNGDSISKSIKLSQGNNRSPEQTPPKKQQKSLKEIYEQPYWRHRMFDQMPINQAVFEQKTFMNIESIKPSDPQQNWRRKSFISAMKRKQSQKRGYAEVRIERKSIDTTMYIKKSINSQLLRTKAGSPINPMKTSTNTLKPFKPPFERYYYRDFVWKIGYSHHFQVQILMEQPKPFRAFIGHGNNRLLIKSLLKQRSWWTIVEKHDETCHFVWTQIKIPSIFKNQGKHEFKQSKMYLPTEQPLLPSNASKILTSELQYRWNLYFKCKRGLEEKLSQQMTSRNKCFSFLDKLISSGIKVHNHLQNNYIIGNKKALFKTMSQYYELQGEDVFEYLPITFHIQSGTDDPEYSRFLNAFYQKAKRAKRLKSQQTGGKPSSKLPANAWIVKPGEFTNRGNGIRVCLTLDQIKAIIRTKQKHPNGNPKTYIVQTYLDRPFLYCKRKFDIRHYMMISSLNGVMRGYWYQQGYLRTTSFQYNLVNCSSGIHLTNDAIQKHLPQYGKYQKGNKLSYLQFEQYLEKHHGSKFSFYKTAYPRMKQIATDAMRASYLFIDRERRQHNFQIFGMDFMIDQNFQPWLLQINTNPCLELSCPLLGRLIPQMVQNALIIGLDPLFPPPVAVANKGNPFKQNFSELNRFHLVFDSSIHGHQIQRLYSGLPLKDAQIEVSEDDEVYDDEGRQLQQ